MKLLRHGPAGKERPGILDRDGQIRDLSNVVDDIAGETLSPQVLAKIRAHKIESLPKVAEQVRIRALRRSRGQIHLHRFELCRSCC